MNQAELDNELSKLKLNDYHRYQFGISALEHAHELLNVDGEINGDQAVDLIKFIVERVCSNGSGRKAKRNDDESSSL